jgi:hypothetical protein
MQLFAPNDCFGAEAGLNRNSRDRTTDQNIGHRQHSISYCLMAIAAQRGAGDSGVVVRSSGMKLIAKCPRPRLAVPVQAPDLLLDILFDFSSRCWRKVRRRKNAFDDNSEGPALLSRLSSTQAVGRETPRTAACLAVVSHPAAINASRISASFEACLAFARRFFLVCRIEATSGDSHPSRRHLVIICQSFVRARPKRVPN